MNDLIIQSVLGSITVLAVLYKAISAMFSILHADDIEERFASSRSHAQKIYIAILWLTAGVMIVFILICAVISLYTFAAFPTDTANSTTNAQNRMTLFDIEYYMGFVAITLIILSSLNILTKKYRPKFYTFCTLLSLLVVLIVLNSLFYGELITLAILYVICWLVISVYTFIYLTKHNYIYTEPLSFRVLSEKEVKNTFSNGMYISHSIQPDIQVITPGPIKNNKFPQYLYYTQTETIRIYEKDPLSPAPKESIPLRSETYKNKAKSKRS